MFETRTRTASENRHSAACWLNNLPDEPNHEQLTHLAIAARVAALKGLPFAGRHTAPATGRDLIFIVPDDTIIGSQAAETLRIHDDQDFFGGVVPHAFVATKAITHPLIEPKAMAPAGWSHEFGRRMSDSVLRGFTAFTPDDARICGERLLERSPIRLKPVRARAGRGQVVVENLSQLDHSIGELDPKEVAEFGIVLEEHLSDVTTFSVGQVRLAGEVASYWGTQRLTKDGSGQSVYGGSDLEMMRGGFEALLALDISEEARVAVMQAREYDAAASACYPGLCASRRNYDVALGTDMEGKRRSGVLEQSWRIGGATPAEIVALEAFRSDPTIRSVRASSVEIYGEAGSIPSDAIIFFSGDDEEAGPITKYARTEDHERT